MSSDLTLHWFKATASTSQQGCVEIAHIPCGGVALRDTKDRSKPAHRFTATAWSASSAPPRPARSTRRRADAWSGSRGPVLGEGLHLREHELGGSGLGVRRITVLGEQALDRAT